MLAPAGIAAALLLGWLVASGRLLPVLIIVGVIVTGACVVRRPELALSAGVFGTLAAGQYSLVARSGHAVLLVAGPMSLLLLLGERHPRLVRLMWLPAVTIAWLTLRLGMGSGLTAVKPFLSCLAAVLLAVLCLARGRRWLPDLAWGGLVFVIASSFLGVLDPTGQRFEGISGNPNRMVFGLLVAIPLMLGLFVETRSVVTKAALTLGAVAAVRLVIISGSDQGTVGLFVVAVAALLYVSRGVNRSFVILASLLAVTTVGAFVAYSGLLGTLSPDVTTLSGRTVTFRAGLEEFRDHFWIGSGLQHVTTDTVVDRSTHNSVIGIAAESGVFGALMWVALLMQSSWFAVVRLQGAQLAAAAALTVVISQLVQTVEVVPLAWAAIVLTAPPLFEDGDEV